MNAVKMTITEYWNCLGIPRGEVKGLVAYGRTGYKSVPDAVNELAGRFKGKLAHKGTSEVCFSEALYVQVIRFEQEGAQS